MLVGRPKFEYIRIFEYKNGFLFEIRIFQNWIFIGHSSHGVFELLFRTDCNEVIDAFLVRE